MDWVSKINWVDVLFLIIVLRSIYVGSRNGFFTELFNVLGVCLAIVLSIHFYSPGANLLLKYFKIPLNISNLTAFIVIMLFVYLLVQLIEAVIKKLIKIEVLPNLNKTIDKIGGPIVGLCGGIAVSLFVFLAFLLIPIGYVVNSAKDNSMSGDFFSRAAATLYTKTVSIIPGTSPVDLNPLLAGAKPLEFKMFQPKEQDKLDEVLD
ncbi:MAG: CvpA family protein [Candidatus Omnitrophica bacterium]|nr:CvpA family protein [Candidatus Omnitrophota bacterium]